ncbi:hypothetical protein F4779DRAFT_610098 [Xylariaceae sp. FL0662B]|nr:hypothetical protein F4779DRAFT_610098 [Xylariaceae sp. FL0662B]
MNHHAANQRSACDRCRVQKLRCPRIDRQSSDPCARCVRAGAGATCAISNSRPLGRPRKKPSKTASIPVWPGLTGDSGFLNGPTVQNGGTEPAMAGLNAANLFGLQPSENGLMLDPFLNSLPVFQNSVVDKTLQDNQQIQADPPGAMDLNILCDFASTPSDNRSSQHFEPLDPTGILVRLSRLNETVAKELAKVESYPWHTPVAQGSCSEKLDALDGNPATKMLQSGSDFVTILRSIRSLSMSSSSPYSSDGQSASGSVTNCEYTPETTPVLQGNGMSRVEIFGGMPTLLLLLSVYIQLIQLYESIFRRLSDIMQQIPLGVMESLKGNFGLHVAGLPSVNGRLFIKLIINIIEDHVETMEQHMGLPAEFRLSESSSCSPGIFSDTSALGLLHDALTKGYGCPEGSAKFLTVSLSKSFGNLRNMLRG